MKKSINPLAIEIQKRFFIALEKAIDDKVLTGLQGFCNDHNLNRTKYQRIRNTINKPPSEQLYKIIDLDALAHICRDYNVSADWLLLGRGEMHRK